MDASPTAAPAATPAEVAPQPVTPQPVAPRAAKRRRRRVWPWVVGGIVVLIVAVLVVGALVMPRASTASGYLTAKAEARTVALTALGTGTVVDARVVSIGTDGSWVVTSRAGVDTGAMLQTAAVTVDKVEVHVGQTVKKGAHLAVVTDAADEETTIKAPVAGVIRSVAVNRGATVSGIVFTLAAGGIRVTADISEYDIADVAASQHVEVSFDGLGRSAAGTVASIGAAASDASQTGATSGVTQFPVVSTLKTAPAGLRLGMSAQLTIDVERVDDVLAVPVQALDEHPDGSYTVTVLDAEGRTHAVDVEVGLIGDSYAQITSGLSAGDAVVIGTAAAGSTTVTTGFPGRTTGTGD